MDHVADHLVVERAERPVFALEPAHPRAGADEHLLLIVHQGVAQHHAGVEGPRHRGKTRDQLAEVFADTGVSRPAGHRRPGRARRQADAIMVVEHRGAGRGDRRAPGLLQAHLVEILKTVTADAGRLLSHRAPRGPRQMDGRFVAGRGKD